VCVDPECDRRIRVAQPLRDCHDRLARVQLYRCEGMTQGVKAVLPALFVGQDGPDFPRAVLDRELSLDRGGTASMRGSGSPPSPALGSFPPRSRLSSRSSTARGKSGPS
jgi:hypothetical protein